MNRLQGILHPKPSSQEAAGNGTEGSAAAPDPDAYLYLEPGLAKILPFTPDESSPLAALYCSSLHLCLNNVAMLSMHCDAQLVHLQA